MFCTIGFLAHQILSIIVSQIEPKIYIFFSEHIYKSKEVSFTIKNLENLIFMSKKWPSDPKDGCKSPFNLKKFNSNIFRF
jgi:hypothetical protein